MSNKTVTGNPGAPKISFDCDGPCGQRIEGPPLVHPWADSHPATDDEMCKDCFWVYLVLAEEPGSRPSSLTEVTPPG